MKLQSKAQFEFLNSTMVLLFANFLEPLFELQPEKNYYTHLGSVVQIAEWSREFFLMHYQEYCTSNYSQPLRESENFTTDIAQKALAFGRKRVETYTQRNLQMTR